MKLYDANLAACLLLRYSLLKQTNDIGGQIVLVTGEEFGNLHSDNSESSNRNFSFLFMFPRFGGTQLNANLISGSFGIRVFEKRFCTVLCIGFPFLVFPTLNIIILIFTFRIEFGLGYYFVTSIGTPLLLSEVS